MIRPQHKPLQAVTKHEAPESGPAGMMSRATPSNSAPPVAESTRTHSVFMGCYRGRPRWVWDKKLP